MSGTKRALLVVALLAFCALAYAPLARAGFVGSDLPSLVHASRIAWPHASAGESEAEFDWLRLTDGGVRPLAAASLALSSRLWSESGTWVPSAAVWLRLENLILLLLAGWMIGRTVQRALVPWYGSEVARSASWASAMILAAHPLSVSVIASPAARGELVALALGALSAALFMRARQERSSPRLLASLLCAALSGLASDLAFLLPVILAVLEYASARRHRSVAARFRTALTTVVGFAALVSLDVWIGAAIGVARAPADIVDGFVSPRSADRGIAVLECAVEKLGVLLLPVPPGIHAATGYTIAGALVFVALLPALIAARSAPKLWGWILLAWTAAIALALLPDARTRVHAHELANAHVLLPGAVAMAAGLAVTSTAVSGIRRTLLPILLGTGYAMLAHASARAWPIASAELNAFADDVARARDPDGRGTQLFVLAPPGQVAGLEVIGESLPLLVDPRIDLQGRDPRQRGSAGMSPPVGIDRAGLFALSREPEFDQLCSGGMVVLLERNGESLGARRDSLTLDPAENSDGPFLWRDDGRSPVLSIDPRRHRALRVTALPDASTAEPPLMGWRSRSETNENGEVVGVWIAGRDGPVALFDLNRSMAWLAGKRIARIWFERSLSKIVSAEILADVPPLVSIDAPEIRGDAWLFSPPVEATLPRVLHGEARWVVGVLDLVRYRYAEFAASEIAPVLLFEGASDWERAAHGPVVWSLEYRVGETTLMRASGRRRMSQ
jgi:hypothetical protein